MILRNLLFFLLLLPVLLLPAGARAEPACTCALPPLETKIGKADKIFSGTVVGIDTVEDMKTAGRIDPPVVVTFAVTEVFKNDPRAPQPHTPDDRALLHTSLTRATCTGHPFVRGKSYLVYAARRRADAPQASSLYPFASGTYDTGGLCGGTRDLAEAESDGETDALRKIRESRDFLRPRPFWQPAE